ncbi:MAG: phosphoglucomutase/phosphomannomutase family protein [Candidatus Aminicenantes bacterium]|nr:phosphoglucomutase/phosphomannomutase family protein [Candidatus Aminicenantes bacterium]
MIKFGTSGWRAVMGEEFTFYNVRLVVQAIANYLRRLYGQNEIAVVVGYDTRFLSERFAFEAAKILTHNQIKVYLADRDAPSQAQALQIIKRQAKGGINFTASFNPPEYNGLKFNVASGAPAMPEVTDEIEAEVNRLQQSQAFCPYYSRSGFIEKINMQADYLEYLRPKVNFAIMRESGLRIGLDLLYGTSREYLDEILEEQGVITEEIHGYVDPYFGGVVPSCTEENLKELKRLVKEKNCHLGIATDADGDRFGIIDEKGNFIDANLILSLLLNYLVQVKGWRGGVARSVATTHLIDRIARRYNLPLYRTPVGFKYLAQLLLEKKIIFGGEESASIAFQGHLPEKDGIYAGLLIAEMVAASGKSLSQLKEDLFREYGRKIDGRRDIPITPERWQKLNQLISSQPEQFAGRRAFQVITVDGIKWDFEDDDWILIRPSGTEPLIRIYAEADSIRELQRLIKFALDYFS